MNASGILLVLFGACLATQILGGDAIGRLGLFAGDPTTADNFGERYGQPDAPPPGSVDVPPSQPNPQYSPGPGRMM